MEPSIQYTKTTDGVSIAFWTLGEGMPFVYTPSLPVSHIKLEWQIPGYDRFFERLATHRKVVRYDSRGLGLSDRNVSDFSLDRQMLDLQAVVDSLSLERFDLYGQGTSGPMAISYAAQYPERVSHLVLWSTWARGSDILAVSEAQALVGLLNTNWNLFTETTANVHLGWSEGELARLYAALARQSVTQKVMQAYLGVMPEADVTALLPKVRAKTLMLHRRDLPFPNLSIAKELASRIPGARLLVLEGKTAAPFLGDMESVLRAIDEFLGEDADAAQKSDRSPPEGPLRTVLFTDLVGHTEMMQRLGDEQGRALLREHERITREVLKAHSGAEIKTMGDGFMASFGSVTKAVECAIALQRAFATHTESMPEPLQVRVGLNAGEPIAEEGDLFGSTVILASRIAAQAGAGEILVPDPVRHLLSGKQFLFSDRGDVALKGFEVAVRLYEVRWRDGA